MRISPNSTNNNFPFLSTPHTFACAAVLGQPRSPRRSEASGLGMQCKLPGHPPRGANIHPKLSCDATNDMF